MSPDTNPIPTLPRMFRLRQHFATQPALDLPSVIRKELGSLTETAQPGMKIAVGVGSRGISNLATIVKETVQVLRAAGAHPFLIPAMGSHGGATPEAQIELLGTYGINEQSMGVPIRGTMSVEQIGITDQGSEVVWAQPALEADGVMVINRIKPHTDFAGKIGSGLIKMAVIGLGKRVGASLFHREASHIGYESALRERIKIIRKGTPLLGGLGLIEDQRHQTAHLEWVPAPDLETQEERLFKKASDLMPKLPFQRIDLLIIDQIGKNISGAGMDPNVMGRSVHGYLTLPEKNPKGLYVRRIFVRDLTPETHGNAIGIGLADVTTRRLVDAMNPSITFVNALTALSTNGAKIPMYFDTDQESILRILDTLALPDLNAARILRIQDTLNVEHMEASEAFLEEVEKREELTMESPPDSIRFTEAKHLMPLEQFEA